MNQRATACFLCGEWTEHRWGVPTYNGELVSNDFPDGGSDAGNQPACERCFLKHERGELLTYDQFYLHLFGGLIYGAGI